MNPLLLLLLVAALRPLEGAKLRVISLHGHSSNGVDFCRYFDSWDQSILDLVEFTCMDAPFHCGDDCRRWSVHEDGETKDGPDAPRTGGNVSIAFLLDFIRSTGPYDGIFGHSEGADVAALLGAVIERNLVVLGRKVPDHRPPRFVLLHEGGIWEGLKQKVFTSTLTMKSFHMIGKYDSHRQREVQLVSKYANPIVMYLNMPHTKLTPQYMDENFKKRFKSFLVSMMRGSRGLFIPEENIERGAISRGQVILEENFERASLHATTVSK